MDADQRKRYEGFGLLPASHSTAQGDKWWRIDLPISSHYFCQLLISPGLGDMRHVQLEVISCAFEIRGRLVASGLLCIVPWLRPRTPATCRQQGFFIALSYMIAGGRGRTRRNKVIPVPHSFSNHKNDQ